MFFLFYMGFCADNIFNNKTINTKWGLTMSQSYLVLGFTITYGLLLIGIIYMGIGSSFGNTYHQL